MPLSHSSSFAQPTDRHLIAIGRLVIEWGNLEFSLRSVLRRLLLVPDFPGRIFTDGMPASRVEQAINDAIALHRERYQCSLFDRETLDAIKASISRIAALRASRNKFAHFCWARMSDEV